MGAAAWASDLGFTCVLFVTTGYIEAAVIPAGARRIRVVEDKPAHSFLGKTNVISLTVCVLRTDLDAQAGGLAQQHSPWPLVLYSYFRCNDVSNQGGPGRAVIFG